MANDVYFTVVMAETPIDGARGKTLFTAAPGNDKITGGSPAAAPGSVWQQWLISLWAKRAMIHLRQQG